MNKKLGEIATGKLGPAGICKECLLGKREIITGEDQGGKKYKKNKEQRELQTCE